MSEVNAEIRSRGYGPARMLEFFFVDVNRHVGVDEVFQAAGVVEM